MDTTVDQTVEIARAEARRMQTAIANAEKGAVVNMSCDQFAVLSQLIGLLCDAATGPAGKLGDPKYWVPLDIFVKAKERAARLQSECEQLRNQTQVDFTLMPASFEPRRVAAYRH